MRARWTAASLAAAVMLGGSRGRAEDGVYVHLDSPVDAKLAALGRHHVGRVGRSVYGYWEKNPECSSPCDRWIFPSSVDQRYVITGDFPESPTFSLSDMTGGVTITVQPGSARRFWGGYFTLIGAAVIFPAPSVLLYIGGRDSRNVAMSAAGIGLAVVGGATAIIGAVYLTLGTTRIKLQKSGVGLAGNAASVKPRYWMGEF